MMLTPLFDDQAAEGTRYNDGFQDNIEAVSERVDRWSKSVVAIRDDLHDRQA